MPKITEAAYMAAGRAYLEQLFNLSPDNKISAQSHDIIVPASVFGEGAEDRLFEVRFILRKQGDLPASLQMKAERQEYEDKLAKAAEAEEAKQKKIVRDTKKRKDAARKQTAADLAAMIAGKK